MSRTVYLILAIKTETSAAYLVFDSDEEKAVWLPKSQVEKGRKVGQEKFWDICEFEVPEWLAAEKGLV